MKIHDYRKEFIDNINNYINKLYHSIFESGDLKIKYISHYNDKTKEELYDIYKRNYNRESMMGKTLTGIHHDDIIFLLDDKNIADWGSNGQQKNAIFAFKLALLEVIYMEKGSYPILILDDLFSALDDKKIKNIINLLNNEIQTFITTTELKRISKKLLENAKKFKVVNASIKEV